MQTRTIACSLSLSLSLTFNIAHAQTLCSQSSPPCVLTGQYDNNRSGLNQVEGTLNTGISFNKSNFGKIAQWDQTDSTKSAVTPIYAQPLYVYHLTIGTQKNVVFVATLGGVLYAFDADDTTTLHGKVLWSNAYVSACGTSPLPAPLSGTNSTLPYAGILSTPVIDSSASTIFFVSLCTGNSFLYRQYFLYAVDLATGNIKSGYPQRVTGAVAGSGDGSTGCPSNCSMSFDSTKQWQRPALLQVNNGSTNTVYVTFGMGANVHEASALYHGWVFAYDAKTPANSPVVLADTLNASSTLPCYGPGANFTKNPCGHGGGYWQSGKGPAANSSYTAFFVSGNGGTDPSTANYGNALISVPIGGLGTVGTNYSSMNYYYNTAENETLNQDDYDMGTGGTLLFNDSVNGTSKNMAAIMDKRGKVYALDQSNLSSTTSPFPITFWGVNNSGACPGGICHEIHNMIYWNSQLILWPWFEQLELFPWNGSGFGSNHTSTVPTAGYPGGQMTLTTTSTSDTTALLWSIYTSGNLPQTRTAGHLNVHKVYTSSPWFNNLFTSGETWNTSPFVPPTVVNGKVYVATYDSGVMVYGCLQTPCQ